ncbi:abscisic acid receptor [Musa troglodytarum]|uniref:Abscisic acid receptor n=1 Tax=Musa troglodytarum TaxID=320322 RepID=A0A9E7JX44_9LILI|nr:abscisic acid receptor [Musa troglodytarum]
MLSMDGVGWWEQTRPMLTQQAYGDRESQKTKNVSWISFRRRGCFLFSEAFREIEAGTRSVRGSVNCWRERGRRLVVVRPDERRMEEEYVTRQEAGGRRPGTTSAAPLSSSTSRPLSISRFDQPHKYKPFISRCVVQGDVAIGSVREVNVISGLPATTSTERLEVLDDHEHVLSVKIVGGDHRLRNYSSIITAHPEVMDGRPGTLVIESFVVDVPAGNTKDETCYFVEALIKCNLKSLADVSERLAVQNAQPME